MTARGRRLNCLWTLERDGRILHMNDGAEIYSGATLAQSRGKPWRDYWPEQNRFSVDRAVASAAEGRVARFRTFDARGGAARTYQDTTVAPVCDADGAVASLVAVSHDVTAEVEAEALMRSVVQSLPSPLTVTSALSRRYVLWNRAAETLFRVDADDALGRTPEELFDPDLAKAIAVDDPEALRAGETHTAAGVAMPRTLGGGVFDIKSLATFDDQGPRHVICLGEEITERL